MRMEISVPALLFPAISLLLLAYTNRFLGLSGVIRSLHDDYQVRPDPKILRQIANLRRRVALIRSMQAAGASAMLLCVLSMFMIFFELQPIAHAAFGISLAAMLLSLGLSLSEIRMSSDALNILLADMEEDLARHADA
ncbi:DUF2721 domain-containing protein [Chitinimonas koreensis]|uniref:DUF2721 domain-containing protein n=1 Tax=Chitinimonas koreensis TaxID=356302 RepID=UPI0004140F94|nr:DUF2721 domain-containing protein [Chitinimonas koreensis]QNM97899.1 DUF2721 domain-containing protein [Chitinimonas koreensis]